MYVCQQMQVETEKSDANSQRIKIKAVLWHLAANAGDDVLSALVIEYFDLSE